MRAASSAAGTRTRGILGVLFLLVAVFACYLPAMRGGFLWDDNAHVTPPFLTSLQGLARIWSAPGATQQYYPLLYSAFWVEHRLWGDGSVGYHAINLLFHAGAAVLAWRLLRRLSVPGAYLAACLFALHPVQAESAAWISEQKNSLSAVFYFASALVYLGFDADRRPWRYWAALGLFLAALLTKSVTATLPAALLVVLWWKRGRLDGKKDLLPLGPWLVLAALSGATTEWIERHDVGARGAPFALTLAQRLILAGRAVWFYAGKLVWPEKLTFIYPRWTLDPQRGVQWIPLVAVLILVGALWALRRRTRAPLAAVLLYIGTLFPALGFFNVYPFLYSFVADHFQYLATLAPFALISAAFSRLRIPGRWPRRVCGGTLVAAVGSLTWVQAGMYRDVETLYRTTLQRNPGCWMAYNNLGKELMARRDRLAEAIGDFRQALRLRPEYPEAEINLGLALTEAGRPEEAIAPLRDALELEPRSFQGWNNLGIALAGTGHAAQAVYAFRQAASLDPASAVVQRNWGKALLLLGRGTEAAEHLRDADRLARVFPVSGLNGGQSR